jgi:branched-chain amino acid transport system ATP-binding protein
MLAIGRALMTNPSLLILDEATEGLAPLIREEIWNQLKLLKETGLSLILIDKDLKALSALAERHFILEKGQMVWSGTTAELLADESLQTKYLGV